MLTRTGDIGSYVFTRGKRGTLRLAFFILLVVAALMLYVSGKNKIFQLGYRIEALGQEKRALERENRSLRIEAASLSSSARIEEIAIKQLGMVRPSKENLIVVKRKPSGTGVVAK